MLLIEAVLAVMHCLSTVSYYILAISYQIGRGIFWLLCQASNYISDAFAVLAIIGEEFHRFILELDVSVSETLQYVRSSTNSGVGGVIDALLLFCIKISNFFTSTSVQSKLLATECGRCIGRSFLLVRNALLLIADWAWWLVTIIPKTLLNILISIGDFLVFGISGAVWLLTTIVRNFIDDIFRYTIALAVIFVLTKQRWRLLRLLIVTVENVKQFFHAVLRSILRIVGLRPARRLQISALTSSRQVTIRSPLPRQNRQSSPCADNLLEAQRCVVCRDQLKCVLLLPCKHLCLCDECANFMVDIEPINAQCPLCRTRIHQSMSVYI